MFSSLTKAFGAGDGAAAAGAESEQLPATTDDVKELPAITLETITDEQRASVEEVMAFLKEGQDGTEDDEVLKSMGLRFSVR